MSKKQVTIEQTIMAQIKSGKVLMKPKWYFMLGSALMFVGLVGLSIGAIFLLNLSFFLLRQHGPMGEWRLQLMLTTFPWWMPVLAIVSVAGGVLLLKKYDFSYKNNFALLVVVFLLAILSAAVLIDQMGINDIWSRKGPLRGMYKRYQLLDQPRQNQQYGDRKHRYQGVGF